MKAFVIFNSGQQWIAFFSYFFSICIKSRPSVYLFGLGQAKNDVFCTINLKMASIKHSLHHPHPFSFFLRKFLSTLGF